MVGDCNSAPPRPGILLALETCFDACSVAVANPDLLAFQYRLIGQGHAEQLAPMVAATLADCGQSVNSLSAIVVTNGPGSFTGVRIGLATARALALPRKLPVHAIGTLELMAWTAHQSVSTGDIDWVAVLHDARRQEVYCQVFANNLAPMAGAVAIKKTDVPAWLPTGRGVFIGTARRLLAEPLQKSHPEGTWCGGEGRPSALWLARCFAARNAARVKPAPVGHAAAGATMPLPLYLRAPDAVLPPDRKTTGPVGRG